MTDMTKLNAARAAGIKLTVSQGPQIHRLLGHAPKETNLYTFEDEHTGHRIVLDQAMLDYLMGFAESRREPRNHTQD